MKPFASRLTLAAAMAASIATLLTPGSLFAQAALAPSGEAGEPTAPPAAGAKDRSPDDRDAAMAKFFRMGEVKAPQGVNPQVGAMAVLPDGRIAVAFHHGEISFFDPVKKEWSLFAEGLHEPLGMLVEKDGSLLVMQRPELTRLKDTTGSGQADSYETVWDGFGMTGNYHEFAFGPVRSPEGKIFVALNLASSGASIRPEIRGQWQTVGSLAREDFPQTWGKDLPKDWKQKGELAGRMYSRVPWRGWVMEVDPATGTATPFASGFRSPDGIGFDPQGHLLISDNQGDWRGASELHVLAKGGFYGHPASLPWRADWDGTPPLQLTIERLNQLRTPAAVWFPYGSYANSPTEMILIPKTPAWGAFGGQILIGEMNVPRLLRLTLEKVHDVWQGACYPFIETRELHEGLHRLVFAGDTLWVGRTHLSWAGGEQLSTVVPTGEAPFDPLEINVTPQGFKVRFTKPLAADASNAALWSLRRYTYAYHAPYGSPELEKAAVVPSSITVSADGLTAELTLPEFPENFVYDFDLRKLHSQTGESLLNQKAAYTLRKKP